VQVVGDEAKIYFWTNMWLEGLLWDTLQR